MQRSIFCQNGVILTVLIAITIPHFYEGFQGDKFIPPTSEEKQEQPLPPRRGAYLTDKCREKSSTWSLLVGSLSDPLTERGMF